MKNTITPLLIAGLLLSGCSSIPIEVNEGRIKAETFSFIKPVNGVKANQSEAHGYNATIQAAVIDYLGNKGIKHVKTGGDLTVGYMIVVRSAVTTSSMSEFYGLGPEPDQMLKRAHKGADKLYKRLVEDRRVDAAKTSVGAMAIDVIDSASFELLFRNVAVHALVGKPTNAQRKELIEGAVGEIFADFKGPR